jgi:hypothetical protein
LSTSFRDSPVRVCGVRCFLDSIKDLSLRGVERGNIDELVGVCREACTGSRLDWEAEKTGYSKAYSREQGCAETSFAVIIKGRCLVLYVNAEEAAFEGLIIHQRLHVNVCRLREGKRNRTMHSAPRQSSSAHGGSPQAFLHVLLARSSSH